MASKVHLIQRNGRWYFNRRFPKELWHDHRLQPFSHGTPDGFVAAGAPRAAGCREMLLGCRG